MNAILSDFIEASKADVDKLDAEIDAKRAELVVLNARREGFLRMQEVVEAAYALPAVQPPTADNGVEEPSAEVVDPALPSFEAVAASDIEVDAPVAARPRAPVGARFRLRTDGGQYLHESCFSLTTNPKFAWCQPEAKIAAVRRKFPLARDLIEEIVLP